MAVNKGTTFLLIGAVVSGSAAAYFTDSYIKDEIFLYRKKLDDEYAKVRIVVPKTHMRAGDVLGIENLALRSMPKSFVHREAIRADEVDSVIGHRLIYPLNGGEALLSSHIAKKRGGGFSSLIKDGKRALTFPVDIVSSMSGFLRPGDSIDLLATLNKGDQDVTFPLLKSIKILAAGNVVDEQGNIDDDGRYQTITLLVNPEDAAKITHAKDVGTLTVLLRSPNDSKDHFNERITLDSLLGNTKEQDKSAKVDIILGGS